MQLKLSNGYSHDPNEVDLLSDQTHMTYSRGGMRSMITRTWNIEGFLFGTSQANLTARLFLLHNAYTSQGFRAVFYDNAGAETIHTLGEAGTSRGGCRVVDGPTYFKRSGAEYTSYRSYRVTLQADYDITSAQIIDFSESLSFVGDGSPESLWLPALNADPQYQETWQSTTFRAIQRGLIVGRDFWPAPPPPRWPYPLLKGTQSSKDEETPMRFGPLHAPVYKEFGVRYAYYFESGSPLMGHPNRWPER